MIHKQINTDNIPTLIEEINETVKKYLYYNYNLVFLNFYNELEDKGGYKCKINITCTQSKYSKLIARYGLNIWVKCTNPDINLKGSNFTIPNHWRKFIEYDVFDPDCKTEFKGGDLDKILRNFFIYKINNKIKYLKGLKKGLKQNE